MASKPSGGGGGGDPNTLDRNISSMDLAELQGYLATLGAERAALHSYRNVSDYDWKIEHVKSRIRSLSKPSTLTLNPYAAEFVLGGTRTEAHPPTSEEASAALPPTEAESGRGPKRPRPSEPNNGSKPVPTVTAVPTVTPLKSVSKISGPESLLVPLGASASASSQYELSLAECSLVSEISRCAAKGIVERDRKYFLNKILAKRAERGIDFDVASLLLQQLLICLYKTCRDRVLRIVPKSGSSSSPSGGGGGGSSSSTSSKSSASGSSSSASGGGGGGSSSSISGIHIDSVYASYGEYLSEEMEFLSDQSDKTKLRDTIDKLFANASMSVIDKLRQFIIIDRQITVLRQKSILKSVRERIHQEMYMCLNRPFKDAAGDNVRELPLTVILGDVPSESYERSMLTMFFGYLKDYRRIFFLAHSLLRNALYTTQIVSTGVPGTFGYRQTPTGAYIPDSSKFPPSVTIGWSAYDHEGESSLRGLFLQEYAQLKPPGGGKTQLVDLLNYHISMGPSRLYVDKQGRLLTKDGGHFTNHFDQNADRKVRTRRLYMLNHGIQNKEVDRWARLLMPSEDEKSLPSAIHAKILAYEGTGNRDARAEARARLNTLAGRVETIEQRNQSRKRPRPESNSSSGNSRDPGSGSSEESGGGGGGGSSTRGGRRNLRRIRRTARHNR
jgi:uncharacterized membrane protein YgcG